MTNAAIPRTKVRRWLDDAEVRTWLAAVPYGRKDLKQRLTSDKLFESYPAIWELMWREAARRKWTPARAPFVGRKTPDVPVVAPLPFALEVVTVFETFTERQDRYADALRDALNAVPTDLVWSMHVTNAFPYPTYDIPGAVARFRAGEITLMPSGERRLLCDDAGIVQLEPHPELTRNVTGICITDMGARWFANDHILWAAIEEKAVAYRPETLGELPLVIAVCSAPEHSFDLNDMVNALCGRWTLHWEKEIATGRVVSSGADRPGGWLLTENRQHVSAVLYAVQRTFAPLTATVHAFTNPFALHPLPLETFAPWPTTRWTLAKPDEGKADWLDGDATLVLR